MALYPAIHPVSHFMATEETRNNKPAARSGGQQNYSFFLPRGETICATSNSLYTLTTLFNSVCHHSCPSLPLFWYFLPMVFFFLFSIPGPLMQRCSRVVSHNRHIRPVSLITDHLPTTIQSMNVNHGDVACPTTP